MLAHVSLFVAAQSKSENGKIFIFLPAKRVKSFIAKLLSMIVVVGEKQWSMSRLATFSPEICRLWARPKSPFHELAEISDGICKKARFHVSLRRVQCSTDERLLTSRFDRFT